jgi:hypothetical protein
MELVRSNRVRILALLLLNVGALAGVVWGAEAVGLVEVRGAARKQLARLPYVGPTWFGPPPRLSADDLTRADALAAERRAASRAQDLDAREEEVGRARDEVEAERRRLAAQEEDLRVREENLARAQATYDSREAEVGRLVTLYTGMRPQEAAAVFERTDDLLVVEILRRMPPANASAILRVMNPDVAARLTRQMGL